MGVRFDRNRDMQTSDDMRGLLLEKGPSGSQAIEVATLLSVCGGLLALAGLTVFGSLIGLAVLTPLFLLFRPILVPAALLAVLAVVGFLSSARSGSLDCRLYLLKRLRVAPEKAPEQLDKAKRRAMQVQGREEAATRT